MKAWEIHQHFQNVGTWVDWRNTCDGFLAGAPEADVLGIGVAWMGDLNVCMEARARGLSLVIVHEPLEDSGAACGVVYRCHDVWDLMPTWGVRDSWCRGLGVERFPHKEDKFLRVYDIPQTTLGALDDLVREKLAAVDPSCVSFVGRATLEVHKLGLGTGAICNPRRLRDMGADVAVITEGAFSRAEQWLRSNAFPVVRVSHAASEAWGIENLAAYLSELMPEIPIQYFAHPRRRW